MLNNIEALRELLKKAASRSLGEKLSELITAEDYKRILDYFFYVIDNNIKMTDYIANLQPGEAYRLDKSETALTRTVTLLCSHQGELKLMIDTKSKVADGTKQKLPQIMGGEKSGKPAWWISSEGEIECFNLVIKKTPANRGALARIKREAELSHAIGSDKINMLEVGEEFSKKNKDGVLEYKLSVYSVKAKCDLSALLKKEQKTFSQAQKDKMMLELLEGVKAFHDENLVHQDIKPANILVYGSKEEGYRIKVTDLGFSETEGDLTKDPISSNLYQSPEIAYCYRQPTVKHHHYFNVRCLGSYYLLMSNKPEEFAVEPTPHKANDMWAAGLVYCEICYGGRPITFSDVDKIDNDLIKRMLEPNRAKRLTVDAAIAILKSQIKEKEKLEKKEDKWPTVYLVKKGSAKKKPSRLKYESTGDDSSLSPSKIRH